MAENTQEGFAVDDLADDELDGLFSAFDGMGASDALKAKTLGAIAALPTAAAASTAVSQASAPVAPVEPAPRPTAQAGGKAARKAMRSPFRFAKVAAVAACVSAALVGGVAYAMPTSHVLLVQGDASIELGVNRFGMVISAESDNDAGRAIIDSNGLLHVSYEDALVRAAGAMDSSLPDGQLALSVSSNDAAQRERLENGNASFLSNREGKEPTPQVNPVESGSKDRLGSSLPGDGDVVAVGSTDGSQPVASPPDTGYQYTRVSQPGASASAGSASRGTSGRTSSKGRVDVGDKAGDKTGGKSNSGDKAGGVSDGRSDDKSGDKSDSKSDNKSGGKSEDKSDGRAAPADPQPDDTLLYWLKIEDPEQPGADDELDSGFEDWSDDELLADDGFERPELVDSADQEPAQEQEPTQGQEPAQSQEPEQDQGTAQDQIPAEGDGSTGWWIPPDGSDSDAWWKPASASTSAAELDQDS